jgi:hypothetical protein
MARRGTVQRGNGAALATRRADERGDVDIRLRGAVPVLVLIVVFF